MPTITDGVWQLWGWPENMFNVFMLGDVLLDGATRWAKHRVTRQIRKYPPRLMVLTHCHPDHQGTARAVCTRFDIPLACHQGDVAAVEGREPMGPDNWLMRLGVRVWAGSPYPVARVLRDGDQVGEFRVVHAPGHTPGHIMLFRESDRVLMAGDVLANMSFLTRQPGLREPPPFFCVDPAENRRSIVKVLELKPRLICFGHGPPLENISEIERLLARRAALTMATSPG